MRQHFSWLGEEVPARLGIYYFSLLIGIYFGYLYWEIAEKPLDRLLLMRFGLIAKGVGTGGWTVLILAGQFAPSYWLTALVSDILWLPFFAFFYRKAKREMARRA